MRTVMLSLLLLSPIVARAAARTIVVSSSIEVLDELRFDGGSASLSRGARATAAVIAETIKGNPSLARIEVAAFASSQALATARADAIVDELVHDGVERERLVARASTKPESHAASSRGVELRILARAD